MAVHLVDIPGGQITLRDARTGGTRTVGLEAFQLAVVPVAGESLTPRHGVSWFEAVALCNEFSAAEGLELAYRVAGRSVRRDVNSAGSRLPTEAEWEYACRAGTTTPTYGELSEIAWTARDHVDGPQPVGGKQPNGFGLFDMLGNVWEWCWDFADPARYWDYRSLRGGGWADEPWSVRASVRRGSAPDVGLEDVGLRLARGAVGQPSAVGQPNVVKHPSDDAAQGWSTEADRQRAAISGPLPLGWTPYRDLLE